MASRREYEMLFQLNAKLGGNYAKTFRSAQAELAGMQGKIQALSKAQSDIAAYQKQQNAVEATGKKLAMLRKFLKDASMTTYTHAPGLGITSITDACGKTTYYQYDDSGRLISNR